MAQRLVLHIGSMKSGTSFIQNVLGSNKARLLRSGVLFPGGRWRDQVAAVTDLIDQERLPGRHHGDAGPWQDLVTEINEHPGTAVVSMEFLAPRRSAKIRYLRSCFPDTSVEAVLTGRDLMRNLPSMWLESVQNGGTVSWPDYVAAVRAERDDPGPDRAFWKHQGLAAISRRWISVLGPERFTLLTVPPGGAPPGLLWERFSQVIGVDPATCDVSVRSNPSIGAATAQVLRRLNERLPGERLDPSLEFYVKHFLAKRGLADRSAREPKLGFDEPWARRRAEREVDLLREMRLRVVGDLEELMPRPVHGVRIEEVDAEAQLAAAVDGLALLVQGWSDSDAKCRQRIRRLRSAQP